MAATSATPVGSYPGSTLAAGSRLQLTATGVTPAGDDLTALHVPIADPASHVWSSSNPWVARVDPRTGRVTVRHPGTVEISIASGGVTGHVTLTVTA